MGQGHPRRKHQGGVTRETFQMDHVRQFVMAGLVPAIHVFVLTPKEGVDARDKRGHDVEAV
jgi:hypothetical protein